MADAVEDLEAAPGNRLMGVLAVPDWDDPIARAPHDQDRYALGQVQPVAAVDVLAAYADDRAQRGKEGGAAVAVGKQRVAASDLDTSVAGRSPMAAKPRRTTAPAVRAGPAVAPMNR